MANCSKKSTVKLKVLQNNSLRSLLCITLNSSHAMYFNFRLPLCTSTTIFVVRKSHLKLNLCKLQSQERKSFFFLYNQIKDDIFSPLFWWTIFLFKTIHFTSRQLYCEVMKYNFTAEELVCSCIDAFFPLHQSKYKFKREHYLKWKRLKQIHNFLRKTLFVLIIESEQAILNSRSLP